ncbi:MAG: beta-lactamase family protein [Chloroflexi bacterium]|nr:beta-lactamase family protein [Chloroflexota bacterium]
MTLDFSAPDPAAAGLAPEGAARIRQVFERQYAQGLMPAAQLVVLRRGRLAVDLAIGAARSKPVTPETPFLVFSCSKAFTGICVHKLIEEGQVSLDARVADYWPEYGCRGKEATIIRQVFLHLAGIPGRDLYRQLPLWPFWGAATRHVARLHPETPPGAQMAYHLVNYGWILGEVVRRVTGQKIDRYLHENFLAPLGLRRTWFRLPRRELRHTPPTSAACADQKHLPAFYNLPAIRRALVPAASLHSTARDLAVFYQMLLQGGEYRGHRYLMQETIAAATTLGYEGYDAMFDRQVRFAYGFHLGGLQPAPGDPGPSMGHGSSIRTFGHFGNRTCMAWADPEAELVVAFTTSRLLANRPNRARWTELSNAVWDALA